MSEVTTEDLYEKMSSIVNLLEEVSEELHLIRQATYGTTRHESRLRSTWEEPKHGEFGAVAESSAQIEGMLMNIENVVTEQARKK